MNSQTYLNIVNHLLKILEQSQTSVKHINNIFKHYLNIIKHGKH